MGHAASQTCPGEARHACEPQARQRSGQGSVVQTGMAERAPFLTRPDVCLEDERLSNQGKSSPRSGRLDAEYSRLPRKFDTPLLITNLFPSL